ncbi:nucleoside triphosphate pyrophosphohydrolase, partial [bacterium]|nr:nucleoside triphosphate pyrophosphohydrolase [bacterium]
MKRQTLEDLKKIMATLRSPQGCPWDREQTPQSLTPYAVEEALELEEAVHHKTSKDVMEELGDLLFQVVFQSQMAEEQGQFSLDDVIHHLSEKMIERHPHVFSQQQEKILTGKKVLHVWEKTKSAKTASPEIFKMPKNFPALLSAVKIGKKTRTIDFDWPTAGDSFKQFMSEVGELKSAMRGRNKAHKEEEVGDALFTLAQV